jgi:hypothetical protein
MDDDTDCDAYARPAPALVPASGGRREAGWRRYGRHGGHDGGPEELLRHGGSLGDDHVTEFLSGGFQPEGTHIEDIVMQKRARGVVRIQVIEGKRIECSQPLTVHRIASFAATRDTAL